MTPFNILVPYNFSPQDEKSLDFVVRTFSGNPDAEVTLFNLYIPVPRLQVSRSTVMEKIAKDLTYLNMRYEESEKGLKEAARKLRQFWHSADKVKTVFMERKKDIASEIADLAAAGNYDIVVLNRTRGRVARFFTGSTFARVVSGIKDATVCIVS